MRVVIKVVQWYKGYGQKVHVPDVRRTGYSLSDVIYAVADMTFPVFRPDVRDISSNRVAIIVRGESLADEILLWQLGTSSESSAGQSLVYITHQTMQLMEDRQADCVIIFVAWDGKSLVWEKTCLPFRDLRQTMDWASRSIDVRMLHIKFQCSDAPL